MEAGELMSHGRIIQGHMTWLSTKQAAERAGVAPRTLQSWVEKGQIVPDGALPGGAWRWRPETIDAFLEQNACVIVPNHAHRHQPRGGGAHARPNRNSRRQEGRYER